MKRKYEQGYTLEEVEAIAARYPEMNREKFDDALTGITCISIDGETIIFECDVEKAVRCGLENRDLRAFEWD